MSEVNVLIKFGLTFLVIIILCLALDNGNDDSKFLKGVALVGACAVLGLITTVLLYIWIEL